MASDLPVRPEQASKSKITLMSDIAPFVSPVDRSVVGSRTGLREHNKRNDVVQIGNDRITPQDNAPMPRAGQYVKRAIETARG